MRTSNDLLLYDASQKKEFMNSESAEEYYRRLNVMKPILRNPQGVSYFEKIKTFRPYYRKVYADLAFGWGAIIFTLFLSTRIEGIVGWLLLPLFSMVIGFFIAYLHLFLHEAAHRGLHPHPKKNDLISNWVIGLIMGQEIQHYREVHLGHHTHHGQTKETENVYFEPLNWNFFWRTLTFARIFEVILKRKPSETSWVLTAGLIFNLSLILVLFTLGYDFTIASWILGVLVFFPFFASLRPILEHRSLNANPRTNYLQKEHGAINRIFGDDLFCRLFGGAGFNKHLLHHFEPSVHYTRLKDFENFLEETDFKDEIERSRTHYFEILFEMLRSK